MPEIFHLMRIINEVPIVHADKRALKYSCQGENGGIELSVTSACVTYLNNFKHAAFLQ